MSEPSERKQDWASLRKKVIGLGEESIRKSYYPELQQRLRELQESKAWFQAIFDSVNDAIIVQRPSDGRVLDVNQRACDMFGYTHDEFLELEIPDAISSGDWPYNQGNGVGLAQRAAQGEALLFEWHAKHKSGRLFWVEASMRAAAIGGESRVLVVVRDVTSRREAEEALRESRRALLTLMGNLPGMAYRCANDAYWTMEFVSTGCLELTGYSPESLIGNKVVSYDDLILPDDRSIVHNAVDNALKDDRPFVITYRIMTKDGSEKWVWEQGRGVYSGDGMLLALEGLVMDVTELKRTEEELRAAEEHFRSLIEQSTLSTAICSPDGRIRYVNPAFGKSWGMPPESVAIVLERYNLLEDQELIDKGVMPFIERAFAGEAVALPPIRYETEPAKELLEGLVHIRKSWWVRAQLYPLKDSDGNIKEVVLVQEDVSAEREAEEREREFYRRTISAATQGKLQMVERDEILKLAGPPIAEFELSSADDISRIRNAVSQAAASVGISEARASDFTVSAGEALANALKHAGGGTASLHILPNALLFVLSDHGSGIETLTLPQVALVKGYTTAGTLGMGYKVMISMSDKVYLATGPGGTTVAIEMTT